MIHEKAKCSPHKRRRESNARLIAGFALNIPLYFVAVELTKWSGTEREFRLNLIGGCLAAAAIVFVIPVFWRGVPWQAPIAFVLISFLPGFIAFSLVSTVVKYW